MLEGSPNPSQANCGALRDDQLWLIRARHAHHARATVKKDRRSAADDCL
jgi:hypothetical protein